MICAFILEHISVINFDLVTKFETSHEVFEALCNRHEHLGIYTQVILLKKAFDVHFDMNVLMNDMVLEIHQLYNRIFNMGPMELDKIFTVLLINALGDQFSHLQATFQTMVDEPNFSSDSLIK